MDFYLKRQWVPNSTDEIIQFHGHVKASDICTLELDALDRALLDDVTLEKRAADHLLVLEMLFRRHDEQKKRGTL